MALFGWLAYGVGTSVGRALLDQEGPPGPRGGPVRQGTEADFRKDEARFAEDEARLEREARAARETSRKDH